MRRKFMKRCFVLGLLLSFVMANFAMAEILLTYDLRVVGGDTAKHKYVNVGESVEIEVYAVITNHNDGEDSIASSSLRFISTEATAPLTMGDMVSVTKNSAFALGALGGPIQYDENPDMEWGGVYPGTSTSGYFNPSNLAYIPGPEVLLGTINWVASSVGAGVEDHINAVAYVNKSTNRGYYTFKSDGTAYSNTNTYVADVIGYGADVVVEGIPEPSTWILLSMGALALLAIRRRK
jgi:hypothetical protein